MNDGLFRFEILRMKRFNWILIILPLLCSLLVSAQEPVVFKGANLVIGNHVSILEDPTNKLSIKEVVDSDAFVNSDVPIPNLQLSKSDFWIKFSIKNESDQEQILLALEYRMLSTCEFYSMADGRVQRLSYDEAFSKRKYKHQNFIFDINLAKGKSSNFYLRVKSS